MKQKCNLRGKHSMFVKPLYQGVFGKLQLPTDIWPNDQRRKSLENANACLIVTFSWSFNKTITFEQFSLIKERIALKIAFWWTFQQLGPHNIVIKTQLILNSECTLYSLAAHQVHMLWCMASLSTVVLPFSL